jgi:hypothetical protein
LAVGACAAFAAGACGGQSKLERGGAAGRGGAPGIGGSEASAGVGAAPGSAGLTAGVDAQCSFTFEDRDGDGVGAFYGTSCTTSFVGDDGADCNDADPTRQSWAYLDHDGDGVGSKAERVCVPAGETPDGYSALDTDCDDNDPARSPSMLDVPGDGIDQDCDLRDALVCTPADTECACLELVAPVPAIDVDCAGYDLVLLDAASCFSSCHSELFVRIANLGASDFQGVITLTENGSVETIEGTIPSGGVVGPRHLGGGFYAGAPITLASDGNDCHPENDTYPGTNPAPLDPLCIPK